MECFVFTEDPNYPDREFGSGYLTGRSFRTPAISDRRPYPVFFQILSPQSGFHVMWTKYLVSLQLFDSHGSRRARPWKKARCLSNGPNYSYFGFFQLTSKIRCRYGEDDDDDQQDITQTRLNFSTRFRYFTENDMERVDEF